MCALGSEFLLTLIGADHSLACALLQPSSRHASFDWADPAELEKRKGAPFCSTPATEIILGPGQVLYLPSYW